MRNLLVILVLLLAFTLRIVFLSSYPCGFTADEASQGYTAYSILKTGKDEWGDKFPIFPRSFGDFKPPLYTYLSIPSITAFGLNEFAVRLPSAVFGSLAVLVTFFLVNTLFSSYVFALLSSFLLAVSPWHISLSRGAFEANLTTFLLPLGFLLFLKAFKNPKYFLFSFFVFGLNIFSYHTPRFLTPLFLFFLIYWKREEFSSILKLGQKKIVVSAFFIFIFILSVNFLGLINGGATRISDIGVFSGGIQMFTLFVNNFLSYFSLEFLFTRGAGEATYGMLPGTGLLYLVEIIFLGAAFISLSKKWDNRFLPLLFWFLISPVPAALASGVGYHANRVAFMMPVIQIFSAYGLFTLIKFSPKFKKINAFLFLSLIAISAFLFLIRYFKEGPKLSSPAMSFGLREVVFILGQMEPNYAKIVISKNFSEPQSFILFYKAWDPQKVQLESQNWKQYQTKNFKFVDQLEDYSLGKYEFRNINWNSDRLLKNTVFVGRENDFPADDALDKRYIPYPGGKRDIVIVQRP